VRLHGEYDAVAKRLGVGLVEAVEPRLIGAADGGRLLQRDPLGCSGFGQPLARGPNASRDPSRNCRWSNTRTASIA